MATKNAAEFKKINKIARKKINDKIKKEDQEVNKKTSQAKLNF
jgi:hypothetical protein